MAKRPADIQLTKDGVTPEEDGFSIGSQISGAPRATAAQMAARKLAKPKGFGRLGSRARPASTTPFQQPQPQPSFSSINGTQQPTAPTNGQASQFNFQPSSQFNFSFGQADSIENPFAKARPQWNPEPYKGSIFSLPPEKRPDPTWVSEKTGEEVPQFAAHSPFHHGNQQANMQSQQSVEQSGGAVQPVGPFQLNVPKFQPLQGSANEQFARANTQSQQSVEQSGGAVQPAGPFQLNVPKFQPLQGSANEQFARFNNPQSQENTNHSDSRPQQEATLETSSKITMTAPVANMATPETSNNIAVTTPVANMATPETSNRIAMNSSVPASDELPNSKPDATAKQGVYEATQQQGAKAQEVSSKKRKFNDQPEIPRGFSKEEAEQYTIGYRLKLLDTCVHKRLQTRMSEAEAETEIPFLQQFHKNRVQAILKAKDGPLPSILGNKRKFTHEQQFDSSEKKSRTQASPHSERINSLTALVEPTQTKRAQKRRASDFFDDEPQQGSKSPKQMRYQEEEEEEEPKSLADGSPIPILDNGDNYYPPEPHSRPPSTAPTADAAVSNAARPIFGSTYPTANATFATLGSTTSSGRKPAFGSMFGASKSPFLQSSADAPPADIPKEVGFSFTSPNSNGNSLPAPAKAESSFGAPASAVIEQSANDSGAEHDEDQPPSGPTEVLVSAGPSEDDEETLMKIRAKALEFDSENNKWATQGLGPLRVLKHRETGATRILMRHDPTARVVINTSLLNLAYTMPQEDNSVRIPILRDGKLVNWVVKVKKDEDAVKLCGILNDNRPT